MKTTTSLALTATALLAGLATSHGQQISYDGINTSGDGYTNSETVTWFNGHSTDKSVYPDNTNTTTIRYGVASVAGGSTDQYFFLFAEVPLYAKNMIWGNGPTEEDWSYYNGKELSYSGATGSEKLQLGNVTVDKGLADIDTFLEVDLAGGMNDFKDDGNYGLIDFKDSALYLLDNGISTEDSSVARDTTMSFELRFAVDAQKNQDVVDLAKQGLSFHLSPERIGPIPEPSSALLLGVASILGLIRRKR